MKETTIYFAGGCFWGTEKFFQNIYGVLKTTVGYANGYTEDPSYKQVCTGETGFAETVEISYNPDLITLGFLIDMYFKTIDPTSLNKQGGDIGTQYRTGIYYLEDADKTTIETKLSELQSNYAEKICVECLPLKNYYTAEEYHQNYLVKNPDGYCHISLGLYDEAKMAFDPTAKFKKATADELKERLSPLEFQVTQQSATEAPFNNPLHGVYQKGIYLDITTGEPLFSSSDKFESGCGWPSFARPITKKSISELLDLSHGRTRTEVRSTLGDSHLGHVFNDGPAEMGGLRYCINSASLRFIPIEDMEKEGYGEYIPLVR